MCPRGLRVPHHPRRSGAPSRPHRSSSPSRPSRRGWPGTVARHLLEHRLTQPVVATPGVAPADLERDIGHAKAVPTVMAPLSPGPPAPRPQSPRTSFLRLEPFVRRDLPTHLGGHLLFPRRLLGLGEPRGTLLALPLVRSQLAVVLQERLDLLRLELLRTLRPVAQPEAFQRLPSQGAPQRPGTAWWPTVI